MAVRKKHPNDPQDVVQSQLGAEAHHVIGVVVEQFVGHQKAVLERFDVFEDRIRRELDERFTRIDERLAHLEAAVLQNSRDIKKNSEDIKKNSEDIEKNSEDIKKNSEDIRDLREELRRLRLEF